MANASTTAVRAKARTMGLFMASFSILVTYAHNSTHDQTHSMPRILDRTNNFRNGLHLMTENLTHSGRKSEFARTDYRPFQLMAKLGKCHELSDRSGPAHN